MIQKAFFFECFFCRMEVVEFKFEIDSDPTQKARSDVSVGAARIVDQKSVCTPVGHPQDIGSDHSLRNVLEDVRPGKGMWTIQTATWHNAPKFLECRFRLYCNDKAERLGLNLPFGFIRQLARPINASPSRLRREDAGGQDNAVFEDDFRFERTKAFRGPGEFAPT